MLRMTLVLVLSIVLGLMSQDQVMHRARTRAALDEADRLERWRSRLISTLAHDLRGPLGTIGASARLLRQRGEELPPERHGQLLAAMERQAVRVEHLARDLLDLARAEHGTLVVRPEPVPLADAVRQAVALLPEPDRVTVAVPEASRVQADPARLEQVLVNLVGNALHHGAPPVVVSTIESSGPSTDRVTIVVSDAGPGVPDALVDRLFEPFAAGESDAAVGLGLWIVRVLVEAHGGRVSYEPASGGGACFVVELPAA